MAWVESASRSFRARHDSDCTEDAGRVLDVTRADARVPRRSVPARGRRGHRRSASRHDLAVAVESDVAAAVVDDRARRASLRGGLGRRHRAARAGSGGARRARVERARLARDALDDRRRRCTPGGSCTRTTTTCRASGRPLGSPPSCAGRGCWTAPGGGSQARPITPGPRSPAACTRAAARGSRPESATRRCSEAP